MDDRFNTASGWVLFAGIIALGLSYISSVVFETERPETLGYAVEVAEEAGGKAEMTMAQALNMEETTIEAGEKVFAKCAACHTITPGGANGIGPNLYGIMGKRIADPATGFAYSTVLAENGGVWDWENMNAWLKSPKTFANGTKMSFAGLSKIEDRAAVSLYMNGTNQNLAVPDYVEEIVEEAGAEDGAAEAVETEAEADEAGAAEAEQDAAAEVEEGGA
ncbi:cytochrome c family protein [Altererythrobacter sp. RZ02]|uniref:Cytochrome c family protein n=1 Tax=Pontixanthobacter rizhaonensis TaxID=2730337 RepID=A0A848QHX3_9SPHN|nr:cytochrome c family protein [Pontixanthobacter rizhaonensis]NMW32252.1 cytochrome c family protein [Pontixanthobacter rizhaonensis]